MSNAVLSHSEMSFSYKRNQALTHATPQSSPESTMLKMPDTRGHRVCCPP